MINIMIAGSNNYKKHRHSFFAIFTLNPDNNNCGITFIPPSYRIYTDDNKIIRLDKADFKDFEIIRKSIKKDLNINVPYYIALYPSDIKKTVDLIEGVDLFILDQFKDYKTFTFGLQYFDGAKLVKYINEVEGNSIYLKYDRILDVMLTLYDNKDSVVKFLNKNFAKELFKSIITNVTTEEMLTLGSLVLKKNNTFYSITLPGGFKNGYYLTDELTLKSYDSDYLKPLIMNIAPGGGAVKVKVLNGTTIAKKAKQLRNELIREGFNVVEFGTSQFPKMKQSIIINRKGLMSGVEKLKTFTGIQKVYHVIDNTQMYDVLIIIGEDRVH